MLKELFKPTIIKNNLYQFTIGYQNIIVLEIKNFKDSIIINKLLKKLILMKVMIYYFNTFEEMEKDLDILVDATDNDFIVIIN